jgi:hypothetical protein
VGVYSHSIASIPPQGGLSISFLRCRASVHQGGCRATLVTEESLFGLIKRPSWGVLIASSPYLIFIDSQVIFNGKLVAHPHRIPMFWQFLTYYKGYNLLSS